MNNLKELLDKLQHKKIEYFHYDISPENIVLVDNLLYYKNKDKLEKLTEYLRLSSMYYKKYFFLLEQEQNVYKEILTFLKVSNCFYIIDEPTYKVFDEPSVYDLYNVFINISTYRNELQEKTLDIYLT